VSQEEEKGMTLGPVQVDIPGTDDNDTVIIGYPGKPHVAGSTKHTCEKCGATVSISPESMNTVLDSVNTHKGRLVILCFDCVPRNTFKELIVGEGQKEEMLKHGVDIEKEAADRGITVSQLARLAEYRIHMVTALEKLKPNIEEVLQRAAKNPDTPMQPASDGKGGFQMDLALSLIIGLRMIARQEPGAIRIGEKVKKVNSEPNDRTPEGTIGEILGSMALPNREPVFVGDQVVHYGYLVAWADEDLPVFTTNLKVEEV
jgi:hypothetical protein